MDEFLTNLKEHKYLIVLFLILFITVCGSFVFTYFYVRYEFSNNEIVNNFEDNTFVDLEEEPQKIVVEIKGQVNVPGVYEVNTNKRVNDVIELADGLTENADVSVNNLSKKVEDEMIIMIYSKDEVKDFTKTKEYEDLKLQECVARCMSDVNACIQKDNIDSASNASKDDKTLKNGSLVSLNKATLEQLLTLPGIGEAKAKAIIEYRKTKAFQSVEDVKNVSGIGESLYAQIKNYITT